jgi:hypothetical protein
MIVLRPGRARTDAPSSLNRHTLVESAISSSFGFAPTICASFAAIVAGQSIQPCLFQLANAAERQRGRSCCGQGAQRIAVEVNDAVWNAEPVPCESERVRCVEAFGFVDGHSFGRVTPFWPIYLPARSA